MGIFLQNMWEEMFGEKLDIIIETDSSAARCVAMRQGIGRIRHLEVRQIYMQQLVKSERLIVKKLPGVDNTADLGTKAVTAATFYHLIELVGLRKFANDELEVIQPWRAKRVTKGNYNSVSAMVAALVGALQLREVDSQLLALQTPLRQVEDSLSTLSEDAVVILSSWVMIGVLVMAFIGAVGLGVALTLGCQHIGGFVHKYTNELKHEELKKKAKPDDEIIVGTTVGEHAGSTVDQPTYPTGYEDLRTIGGFTSNGGICLHLDENCIIKHSCHGLKAERSYKFWCKKCSR
jgi:hypothetical protein